MGKTYTGTTRIILFGLFALICSAASTYGQTFKILAVDTTAFPTLSAYFTAFDYVGTDYANFQMSEFDVWENGVLINPKVQIKCETSTFKPPISVVLVTDVSGSMMNPAEPPNPETLFQWVKDGAKAFVDSVQLEDPSRVMVLPFAGNVLPNSDFQVSKDVLRHYIDVNLTTASGSTDFNVPFLGSVDRKGAIWHLGTRPAEIRRVIVFLTDGKHEKPGVAFKWREIVDSCKANQIQVYTIVLKESVAQELMWISEQTGGKVYQVSKKNELLGVYRQIAHLIQFKTFCRFVWTSEFGCDEQSRQREIKATFKRVDPNLTSTYKFTSPTFSVAKLSINQDAFYFGKPSDGTVEHDVVLTAHHADFNVTGYNITPDKTAFTLSKMPPFTIKKGASETVKVRFVKPMPANSIEYSLTFDTDPCPTKATSLIAPCGGVAIDSALFANVPVSTSEDRALDCVFKNTTALPISGNAVIEGADKAMFSFVEGGGAFTLEPDGCLNVKIRFSPASVGRKTAKIVYNIITDCGSPYTDLIGTSIATDFTMPTIDWKERRIKTTNGETYTFKNNSTADINIIRVELAEPANVNFTMTAPTLPVIVQGGGELSFPVSFAPQSEGLREVEIILEIEGLTPALRGRLTGIGFLPAISSDNVIFPPTRVDSDADPLELVIKNTSAYGPLNIREITIEQQQDFGFGTANLTNIVIPKNSEHRIPVTFKPTAPGTRTAKITVKNDAKEGPEPVETQLFFVDAIGSGMRLDVVDKLDFGTLSTCQTLTKSVSILNSGSGSMEINAVVAGQNPTAFELETSNLTIPAGGTGILNVIFMPTAAQNYSAILKLSSSAGDADVALTGIGSVLQFKSQWSQSVVNIEIAKPMNVQFSSDLPNIAPTTISKIVYHISYNPKALKYDNASGFSSSPADWNWTVNSADELKGKLTITGSGTEKTTPFKLTHNLSFKTYLSGDSTANISVLADFESAAPCLVVSADILQTKLQTCFTQGHLIIYSPTQFQLSAPEPNPAYENVNIKYNVAFDAVTKIEIYNSMGVLVKTIADGNLKAGAYESKFPVSELSSGIYIITMQSGPYSATRQLAITK